MHLPVPYLLIADVIIKVKNLEELTAEEDLIYLVYIEGIPKEEAVHLIAQESYLIQDLEN